MSTWFGTMNRCVGLVPDRIDTEHHVLLFVFSGRMHDKMLLFLVGIFFLSEPKRFALNRKLSDGQVQVVLRQPGWLRDGIDVINQGWLLRKFISLQ